MFYLYTHSDVLPDTVNYFKQQPGLEGLLTFLRGRRTAVEQVVAIQCRKIECGSRLSGPPVLGSTPTHSRATSEGTAEAGAG